MSEPEEFALEAAVAPRRVLVCQAQDQVAEFVTDWWAARLVGIGPFSGDQAAVPGQQRRRGDDAMPTQVAGEQAGQSGQNCPLRPTGSRSADAAAQHSDFVAQDQNLDVLGGGAAGEQPKPANTVTQIRYSSRNSTARDHVMLTCSQ